MCLLHRPIVTQNSMLIYASCTVQEQFLLGQFHYTCSTRFSLIPILTNQLDGLIDIAIQYNRLLTTWTKILLETNTSSLIYPSEIIFISIWKRLDGAIIGLWTSYAACKVFCTVLGLRMSGLLSKRDCVSSIPTQVVLDEMILYVRGLLQINRN